MFYCIKQLFVIKNDSYFRVSQFSIPLMNIDKCKKKKNNNKKNVNGKTYHNYHVSQDLFLLEVVQQVERMGVAKDCFDVVEMNLPGKKNRINLIIIMASHIGMEPGGRILTIMYFLTVLMM